MTEPTPNESSGNLNDDGAVAFEFDNDTPDSQIWTAKEKMILKAHLEGYRGAPRKTKSSYVATTVVPEIKETWKGRYDKKNMKKDRAIKKEWEKKKYVSVGRCPGTYSDSGPQQIFTWFGNHAATERGLKIPGFNFNVTFDTVVQAKKKMEIQEEARRLSGGSEDTRKWLPYYQTAKKSIKDTLSEAEREEYEREVEEWKTAGIPKEVQAETASRHGKKLIHKMDQLKWKSMRMRTFSFECHYNTEGKMSYSVFDTQSLVADGTLSTPADSNSTGYRGVRQVPTFSQYDPTAYQAIKKAYLKYIKHIASIEKGTAPAANTMTNFTMADLKCEPSGLPRLPDPIRNSNSIETNIIRQQIIRAYVAKHYHLATGKNGPVPYKAILQTWTEFVLPIYLPRNIPLKDPSKYESTGTGRNCIQFDCILGEDKLPEEADYPAGLFRNMVSPGPRSSSVPRESFAINQPHKSTFTSATPSDSEDEEDQDDLPFKKHRAACSDDDSDEGEQPEVMSVDNNESTGQEKDNSQDDQSEDTQTHQAEGTGRSRPRHPTAAQRPRGRLLITPRVTRGDHSQDFGSSPTLQGSSPAVQNRSRAPLRRAPLHRGILLTPEPSNASTPAPQEEPRALRSKTKAEAAAQKVQSKTNANTGTEGAMKTRSRARGSPSKSRAKKS
ncbi:hypothetical protein BDZ97DRAFT_1926279 [Flammula alnicola]|nr:hypothetical protein BDZ97DRAFT_1926279 [Flammula alnicola]